MKINIRRMRSVVDPNIQHLSLNEISDALKKGVLTKSSLSKQEVKVKVGYWVNFTELVNYSGQIGNEKSMVYKAEREGPRPSDLKGDPAWEGDFLNIQGPSFDWK